MEATIIYPHQLFAEHPAIADDRRIYLVEEPLLLTHNPIHRQKLMLHKLSMDAFERELSAAGHTTVRLTIGDHPTSKDVFARLERDGVTRMHIVDTTDCYLERAITASGIERAWYESPLFILSKNEACERFTTSKKFMASFYMQLCQDKNILIDDDKEPTGGKWSFDVENRKKIPKGTELPEDLRKFGNSETKAAADWAEAVDVEKYGEAGCWLPYTHQGAEEFLQEFFSTRFEHFGPYEDAMTTHDTRLWHSTISPLLNIGLLTPQYVLDEAITYAQKHSVPMNSLEGFVRQLIGWREFMRASYEVDGNQMRSKNFFNHTRTLPDSYWDGSTSIDPVDDVISTALEYGYNHHIERLMVMGNVMLLSQIEPNEVYRWFMGMYVDAYDWVMVPNVYGMSQFADGGSFATKPYISGANYIKKMSDYPTGDWEATWTALYWNFINTHQDTFKSNHRMSMIPRLLENMDTETREQHLAIAEDFLAK